MVGLVLAVVGVFYPVLLLALGVPASVGLGVAGWRPFRRAVGELIPGEMHRGQDGTSRGDGEHREPRSGNGRSEQPQCGHGQRHHERIDPQQ